MFGDSAVVKSRNTGRGVVPGVLEAAQWFNRRWQEDQANLTRFVGHLDRRMGMAGGGTSGGVEQSPAKAMREGFENRRCRTETVVEESKKQTASKVTRHHIVW